jgi:hypothetical protein
MAIPYTVQSTPKTTPISAQGLNDNFNYLEKTGFGGIDIPVAPSDINVVYVLASQGGFLFWMPTEECP